MIKNTNSVILGGILFVLLSFTLGCSKGGLTPVIGDITGPDEVYEGDYNYFEVQASGTNIQCDWSCDPEWAGQFSGFGGTGGISGNPAFGDGGFSSFGGSDLFQSRRSFYANEVTEDTEVIITAVVSSDQYEPVVVTKRITILNGPI